VEIKLECELSDFSDMIKMMAIPSETAKTSYINPIIFPMIKPSKGKDEDGMLEWVVKSEVTTWVRIRYTKPTGITEPTRIPINVENALIALKMFKKDDKIIFIHDEDKGIQIIKNTKWDDLTEVHIPIPYDKPGKDVYDGFPGALEPETEIVLFKQGAVRPDISGSCKVDFFKDIFKAYKIINTPTSTTNSKKKETVETTLYKLVINEDGRTIEAFTDKEKSNLVIYKTCVVHDIKGHGEVRYTSILEDVINVLSGSFKFHTVTAGPLWIMQDTRNTKVRYLVPPAASHI